MAGTSEARYETTDPLATGPDAVERAFENQVAYCRDNQAPITAAVCTGLLQLLSTERGGAVLVRVRAWSGPPLADALPLRLAGGLHALHLAHEEPMLASLYAGRRGDDVAGLLAEVLERHEAFLLPWLDGPPQTNEAGRSWAFAAAMLWLADQGLPNRFAMHELGSSAGINVMMDRYAYNLGGARCGSQNPVIGLQPEWRGPPPPAGSWEIVSARGCDLAPVDLTDPAQAMRLKAYVWPEATERFSRMGMAIEAARKAPPTIAKMAAGEFVEEILDATADEGVTRLIVHSVMWQYLTARERGRITALIERAGSRASEDAPLAWVALEANRDTHRHELRVRYWPGGENWAHLGAAHPHCAWVEWNG
jgi:hypothetical protein